MRPSQINNWITATSPANNAVVLSLYPAKDDRAFSRKYAGVCALLQGPGLAYLPLGSTNGAESGSGGALSAEIPRRSPVVAMPGAARLLGAGLSRDCRRRRFRGFRISEVSALDRSEIVIEAVDEGDARHFVN